MNVKAIEQAYPHRDLRADAAAIGATLSWALSFVVRKHLLNDIDPLAMTLGVLLANTAFSFGWLYLAEGSLAVALRDAPALVLSGACGYALFRLGSNLGLGYSSVFSSTILLATSPFFASLFSLVSGTERVSARQWLGQAVTLAGVVLLAGRGMAVALLGDKGPGVGDLFFLGSAAAFGAFGVVNQRLVKRYSSLRVTSWATLTGTLLLLPVAVPSFTVQEWRGLHLSAWLGLAYTAFVSSFLALAAWNWAIARRGAAAVTPFMNLVPVFAGGLAWAMLGEAPDLLQILGAVLVTLGLRLAAAARSATSDRPWSVRNAEIRARRGP